MEETSRLKMMFDAVKDKNLYGRAFFYNSFFYLIIGLIVQYYVYYLLTPTWLVIYVPLYFAMIFLLSGLFAKNFKKEFHPMGWWLALLLLLSSTLAKAFAIIAPFENTFIGFLKRLLVLGIPEPAFLISLVTIAVFGQRLSLRNSIGLDDKFFVKEKNRWKSEVKGFPNFDKILESLDGGQFVAGLFDKGLFSLAILWSCNVMEEVVDAIADGITSKAPEKKAFFKTEEGRPRRYTLQLKNLGYASLLKRQENSKFNVNILWHKVRNDIAHHNYTPTFNDTNATLKILILFVRETPFVLQQWHAQF